MVAGGQMAGAHLRFVPGPVSPGGPCAPRAAPEGTPRSRDNRPPAERPAHLGPAHLGLAYLGLAHLGRSRREREVRSGGWAAFRA
jgi:hypothetical protein